MSTHQQTNPRRANQSIADESGRPGTVRSNVGCEAIEEPCTKSSAGLPSGAPTNFSQRKRRTSPSAVRFVAQWATPVTVSPAVVGAPLVAVASFMRFPGVGAFVGLLARPAAD